MSLSCLKCNKPLIKYQKKYCSNSCAAKVNNIKRGRFKSKPVECPHCGKITIRENHSIAQFCSNACHSRFISPYKNKEEAKKAKRTATKKWRFNCIIQTPPWADLDKIKEIYLNCPKGYEVDHIHPISKGGLHVDYNLQYLTISENRSKNNKI